MNRAAAAGRIRGNARKAVWGMDKNGSLHSYYVWAVPWLTRKNLSQFDPDSAQAFPEEVLASAQPDPQIALQTNVRAEPRGCSDGSGSVRQPRCSGHSSRI